MTKNKYKKLIGKYILQIRGQHQKLINDFKNEILKIRYTTYEDYLFYVDEVEYYEKHNYLTKSECIKLYKLLDEQLYDKWIDLWKYSNKYY